MRQKDKNVPVLSVDPDTELLNRHHGFNRELFDDSNQTRDYLLDPKRTPDADFLPLLGVWHRHKLKANDEFRTLPELLAIGQYDDLTHFILELVQNGDDNEYAQGVLPMLRMDFTSDGCTLVNNELGFQRKHILAICTFGLSTKREMAAHRFIGEKGIGFKSVFTVADRVEIVSGKFAFALNRERMILPEVLPAEPASGTIIRLRQPNRQWLTALEALSHWTPDHLVFMLFLKRLQRLEIHHPAGSLVATRESAGRNKVMLSCGDRRVTFYVHRTSIQMPASCFPARFTGDVRALREKARLDRELVLAAPLEGNIGSDSDTLFAFLPVSAARSALHALLHFDFKVSTNRESLAVANEWNEYALNHLPDIFCGMVETWSKDATLVDRILQILPDQVQGGDFSLDLRTPEAIKVQLRKAFARLREMPIFRSTVGSGRYVAGQMRTCSPEIRSMIQRLIHPTDDVQLVRAEMQTNYPRQLEALGVRELSQEELLTVLERWTPGSRLLRTKEISARREWLLTLAKAFSLPSSASIARLRKLPVFPFHENDEITFGPLDAESIEVVLRREGAVGTSIEVAQTGVRELEPQMTLRSHTRTAISQIHPATRIFDWLRDVMGLKEADDLLMLERVVIPRFQRLASCATGASSALTSEDDLAQLWSDLAFAARVLQRKTSIVDSKRPIKADIRFENIFNQLSGVVRLPNAGEAPGTFTLASPSKVYLGEPYTDQIMSQVGAILFGRDACVLPPPEGITTDELGPLLKRMGCFHSLRFEKVELSYAEAYKQGFINIPSGKYHRISTMAILSTDSKRMEALQTADRVALFEVLTRLPDRFFAELHTSMCYYFFQKGKTEPLIGSAARTQLGKYLRVRNLAGGIVSPVGLVDSTEQHRQLLAELPELLICGPANSLAKMLGSVEQLDWNWFAERSGEWHIKVKAERRPNNRVGDTWEEFGNWARSAVKIAEFVGGDVAERLRRWVNDLQLIPWESNAKTLEQFSLDGEFVWLEDEATDNLLCIQTRAEEFGLTQFFQRIGFAPAPIPDHPMERWRYCYQDTGGPQRQDLQALLELHEQHHDGFQSTWDVNQDRLWCPPHGWIAPPAARTGGPQIWREALMNQEPIAWAPSGLPDDRLTALYQAGGAKPLHAEPIRLATGVETQELPQKIIDALDMLRREIPRLGWLLPNGLTSLAVGSDDGIAAVWQKGNGIVNLPYPQNAAVVERTLCTMGDGTAKEQVVAFLREQGLKPAAAALVEELSSTTYRHTEKPQLSPEQEEQAAREAVQDFQAGLASKRGAIGGPLPTPIPLADPTLLPASPEEAEQRLIEYVRRNVDASSGLQSRVLQVLLTTATKSTQERTQEIRREMAGWYQGYCQHCGVIITKRNGQPFFNDTRMYKVRAAKILDHAFNRLLLCPNCAARMDHNDWAFAAEAFRVPESEIKHWDFAWPNATAPSAAGGYCIVQFTVAGEPWEIRFHPDHYELIRVAFTELGI